MANNKRGILITDHEMNQSNYKGFLPQIVKSKELLQYFIDNYVDKDYIEEHFREDFLVHGKYKTEISYYPVYRVSWDAKVKWNTQSTSSETIGDYVLTTTTTTRHTRNNSSGTTLFPESSWADSLHVKEFNDNDIYTLGSVEGLDLHFFSVESAEGDFVCHPLTQKEIGQKALDTAVQEEGKDKSVSITWSDLVVLVPIFSVYDAETNKSVFVMNLYNKKCALDDVPLRPDLHDKLVVFTRVGTGMKWTMVLAWALGQVAYPFMAGTFKWWNPFVWVGMFIVMMIMMFCCGNERAEIRTRITKKQKSNFFGIMLWPFIWVVFFSIACVAVSVLLFK